MAGNFAEIYVKLGLDKKDFDKNLSSTSGSLKKFSTDFNKDFIEGLSKGTTTTKEFGNQLLTAAKQAGLGTSEIRKMAVATGFYTDKQILAADSSANVAKKAQEVSQAIAKGEMTTREGAKAFADYVKEEQKLAESSMSTSDKLKSLGGDLLKMGTIAGGAIAGVVALGKALYELGGRGAIVTQTTESFEYLSKKLELPTDTLDRLRQEARGTVDDMTLMSSTATLLAGTTDELGKALGKAAPDLMEIAKAANKLNPSLGTTAHMYESIALGIKRASPMILDNLGLTIKIGDANEKMAEKLNKSVDALTAEEKQMALLEATLTAGDNLIQQVGGSTEAATDAYEQNAAAVANLKDALSATVNEGIYPLIQGLADFYSAAIPARDAYALMHEAMEKGIITEAEMIELDRQQAEGLITLEDIIVMLRGEIEKTDLAQGLLNSQMEEAKTRYAEAKSGAEGYTGAIDNSKISQEELNNALKKYSDQLLFNLAAEDLSTDAAWDLAEAMGLVDEKSKYAYDSIGDLKSQLDNGRSCYQNK